MKKVYFLTRDLVHDPVFLIQAAGPTALELTSERLRLADSVERIPERFLDDPQQSFRKRKVFSNPVPEIIEELLLHPRGWFRRDA